MHKKALATGLCRAHMGQLTALPDPLAQFKGAASRQRRTGKGLKGKREEEPSPYQKFVDGPLEWDVSG